MQSHNLEHYIDHNGYPHLCPPFVVSDTWSVFNPEGSGAQALLSVL